MLMNKWLLLDLEKIPLKVVWQETKARLAQLKLAKIQISLVTKLIQVLGIVEHQL